MTVWSELAAKLKANFQRIRRPKRSPRAPRNLWRPVKWTAGIMAGCVAIIFLVLALIDWNAMRGPVAHYLSARLQREVQINGDLDVRLFSWTPRAVVNELVVLQPHWVTQQKGTSLESFAKITRLAVSIDLGRLLTGRIVLPELTVERPQLSLYRDASGRANWSRNPDAEDSPARLPPIRHFVIKDGGLAVLDIKRKLEFSGTVSSEETDIQAGQQTFHLNGKGQLNRQPFSVELKGDPLLNVAPDEPYGFQADVRAGASHITAKGALDRPFDLGAFQVAATFAGPDLADLYYLTGLALPNTPPYQLSGDLTRHRDDWRFQSLKGKVGDSDLHGDIRVDAAPERPHLSGDIASRHLDFNDLGPLIGAPPATNRGETASSKQKLEAQKLAVANRVLPDSPLDVERLRQMDGDLHYRAETIASRDLPLRAADLKVSLKAGILKIDPVDISFSKGRMVGSIQIDARNSTPQSDIDVRVTGLSLDQLTAAAANSSAIEGDLIARAKLHGSGNSVHKALSTAEGRVGFVVPHGVIRQSFAELFGINIARALLLDNRKQTDIRCAAAEFSAQGGIMALNQFVFDTEVVQVSGEGNIDLHDEAIHLTLNGHSKKPRLLRLRAPITIGGTLAHPVVGVDASKVLTQGSIAAGLALALSPLATILPFIDPGLGKDADCGALLQQAQASGTPTTPVTR